VKQASNNTFYRALWDNAPQSLPGCRDGPGGSCSGVGLERYVKERQAMFEGFSQRCGTDYKNTTDVLGIYGAATHGSSVGKV